jgi:hypothetical protein
MEFYFLNWVQLSYDSGKVVLGGTTQGKVYHTKNSENICNNNGGVQKDMKFSFMSFNPPP